MRAEAPQLAGETESWERAIGGNPPIRVFRRFPAPDGCLIIPTNLTSTPNPHDDPLLRGARHLRAAGVSEDHRLRELRASIAAFGERLRQNPDDVVARAGRAFGLPRQEPPVPRRRRKRGPDRPCRLRGTGRSRPREVPRTATAGPPRTSFSLALRDLHAHGRGNTSRSRSRTGSRPCGSPRPSPSTALNSRSHGGAWSSWPRTPAAREACASTVRDYEEAIRLDPARHDFYTGRAMVRQHLRKGLDAVRVLPLEEAQAIADDFGKALALRSR